MVNVEAPIISCLSLREETSWKSRILNKMLTPQQESFWHSVLIGGDQKQWISQGMVETAWYLPGGQKDDKFSTPVTFTNCRGNALKLPAVCDALIYESSVSCLFVEKVNKEIHSFLRNKKSLERIILVVLHKREEEEATKSRCKKSRKALTLEKHQIIQKSTEDSNFHLVYERLNESMEKILNSTQRTLALSSLVNQLRNESMHVDDQRCQTGKTSAQKILTSIDGLNKRKP